MQLLDAVRCGQRPIIPENTSEGVKSIIQECWQQNSTLRPNASEVARLLQEQLETTLSVQVGKGDTGVTPAGNCFSGVDVSIQSSGSSRITHNTYLSLSSDLSDTDEPTNAELQIANSSACLEYNIVNLVVHDGESSDDAMKANGKPISSSFSFRDNELEHVNSILGIEELKEFHIKCISSVKEGKDVVIQPTGF